MAATAVAAAGRQAPAGAPRVSLSLSRLLLLYLVIPLGAALFLVDQAWLGGALRERLPAEPNDYVLFEVVFGWPHILASTIILATNREYLLAYRRRLVGASAVIVGFFSIGYVTLPYAVLFGVAATATIIHVLKQQIGIGRGAARVSSRVYTAWGWTAIAAGVVLYNGLLLDDLAPYRNDLVVLAGVLVVAVVVLAMRVHRQVEARLGRVFLWSNTLLVVSSLFFYGTGYGLLAIAIPRVVHDTTAFAFYVAHDANKHGDAPRNRLYRLARRLPGGVYWVTPALAVAVAFLLDQHGDGVFHWLTQEALKDAVPKAISLGVLGYLGMMHYYYESFTWKTGSPYRAHIALRA